MPGAGATKHEFVVPPCLVTPLQVLLGCDGPFSGVRAQCIQDSEPAFDVSQGARMCIKER